MWEDRNIFSLSGDSDITNFAETTLSGRFFNPASGYVESPKKMLAGSIYSAEKRLKLTGNVLCRAIGRRPMYNLKVKPEQVRCAQSCAPFFPVCVCRRFLVKLSLVHRKRFLVIFPSSNLGESGFPNFTLSPSF